MAPASQINTDKHNEECVSAPGRLPPSPALPIPEVVSGTVITTSPPNITKVGRKYFVPIGLKGKEITEGGKVIGHERGPMLTLSEAEWETLRAFTQCWDYDITATEVGIKAASVRRMLRKPVLRRYIEELTARAAIKHNANIPWVFEELLDVWEGRRIANQIQMDAMKTVAKLLTPKTPAVHISAGPGGSRQTGQGGPYDRLMAEDVDGAWADRRAATDGGL